MCKEVIEDRSLREGERGGLHDRTSKGKKAEDGKTPGQDKTSDPAKPALPSLSSVPA